MKILTANTLFTLVLLVAASSNAAQVSIREYPDRYVVEVDGSMDPKATTLRQNAGPASMKENKPVVTPAATPSAQAERGVKGDQDKAEGTLSTESPGKPYNRAEQVKAYLAKIPNRQTFVENRLETQQMRWTKRQERKLATSTP